MMFLQTWFVAILSYARRGAAEVETAPGQSLGIIHTAWTGNYYHWITEGLPRALALKEAFPDALPILPSQKYAGYAQSLEAVGFTSSATFPDGRNLIARNAILSTSVPGNATIAPGALLKVRQKILENLELPEESRSRIVYISRERANCRRVVDEDRVLEALSAFGAVKVNLEDMSFREQVELMRSTKLLIGPHGAGFTNMLFMPPGGGVIEIIPGRCSVFDYSTAHNSVKVNPCFIRLAQTMNHSHDYLVCQTTAGTFKSSHFSDLRVDTDALSQCVGSMLERIKI